jgi:hypothetical protein
LFLKNAIWVLKTQNSMPKSLEKVAKDSHEKVISEKVTEKLSFMDSNSALNFALYETQTEFLLKNFSLLI